MRILLLIVEAALIILAVDFASGLVHWAEDTLWNEETPVMGRWIVTPNVLHHRDGGAFIRNSWLHSSWDLMAAGLLILGMAWFLDVLSWHVWLFVALGANANQIHKWAHLAPTRVPTCVRLLQRIHLLQSSTHHAVHHRGGKNSNYCVITEVLNPVLERIRFWRGLEQAVVPVGGAPRRTDIQVPRSGES